MHRQRKTTSPPRSYQLQLRYRLDLGDMSSLSPVLAGFPIRSLSKISPTWSQSISLPTLACIPAEVYECEDNDKGLENRAQEEVIYTGDPYGTNNLYTDLTYVTETCNTTGLCNTLPGTA